jgi:hypothetical protein
MKPIFQNNDLSLIWDKLDAISVNGNEYEYSYYDYAKNAIFPVDPKIRSIVGKNVCISGKLKRLFVNFKFSDIGTKDIYLIGSEGGNIFYSLPVISFINTNNLYQFNFSPAYTTKNNDNTVINIEINDIPIPNFNLLTSVGVYFYLSLRYDQIEPVNFNNLITNYFYIQYSLNLIDTNENPV